MLPNDTQAAAAVAIKQHPTNNLSFKPVSSSSPSAWMMSIFIKIYFHQQRQQHSAIWPSSAAGSNFFCKQSFNRRRDVTSKKRGSQDLGQDDVDEWSVDDRWMALDLPQQQRGGAQTQLIDWNCWGDGSLINWFTICSPHWVPLVVRSFGLAWLSDSAGVGNAARVWLVEQQQVVKIYCAIKRWCRRAIWRARFIIFGSNRVVALEGLLKNSVS